MMIAILLLIINAGITATSTSKVPIPRVLTPPCSKNVTLNHEVSLNCTAVASHIFWEIVEQNDSRPIYPDPSQYVTVDAAKRVIKHSLTMIASSHENNASVRCIATFSTSQQNKSDWARILVQGLLKEVSNLTVSLINSTTVLISWSPPFTLKGVPILGYNVTITNTTSGEKETKLAKNITLPLAINHPDPENNFTVTVVPINEVGAGHPKSTMVQFLIPEPAIPSISFVNSPWATLPGSLIMSRNNSHMSFEFQTSKPLFPKNPDKAVIIPIICLVVIGLLVIGISTVVLFAVKRLKKIRSKNLASTNCKYTQSAEQQEGVNSIDQEDDPNGDPDKKQKYELECPINEEQDSNGEEDLDVEDPKDDLQEDGDTATEKQPLLQTAQPCSSLPSLTTWPRQPEDKKNRHKKYKKYKMPDDHELNIFDRQKSEGTEPNHEPGPPWEYYSKM